MLMSNHVLVLEVVSGSNIIVPSHREPTGLYVMVSTARSQSDTAVKNLMADDSVHWDESLIIQGHSLMFPRWLMTIFPSTLKAVHLEIRASFETAMLGRGELLGRVDTTLQEFLAHGKELELSFPVTKTQSQSLLLRVQRIKPQPRVDHGLTKPTGIDLITDIAQEAYALYRTSNLPNDLDRALEGFQAVLDQCPIGHPRRDAALSNLAHAIVYGFTKGAQIDIDYAISLFRSALELRPQGHPDHPLSIFNLCKAHYQRYVYLQDQTDLHETIKLYLELVPLCLEGSHLQFRVLEECNALPRDPSDESISLRRMVLDRCPQGHRLHAYSMNRLAGDLYARFGLTKNIDDINEAIYLSRKALSACDDDGERGFFLGVLSYVLRLRFHHLRSPEDINESIRLNREALSLRPPGHPGHQRYLNKLINALKARYELSGSVADLEEARHLYRTPPDLHAMHSGSLHPPSQHSDEYLNLGRDRASRTPGKEEPQQRLDSLSSGQQTSPRARNVVIFGESGSGKSSIVNAITQSQRAKTSSSAVGCTFQYEKYEVDLSGKKFVLYDTVGLDEGTAGTVPAAEAAANLKRLLGELMGPGSDGIGLLVYCVRSVRVSRALLRNYNLFYSAICRKKVPIVIVVTGLENQEPTMDSWWDANEKEFRKYGMHFEDHACVTTLRNHPGIADVFTRRITESRDTLRSLIPNSFSEWKADENWFKVSFAEVRNMISDRWNTGRSSPSTLVICDPSRKEVEIARGIHCTVESCFVHINGVKYQVYSATEPKSPTWTSSVEADLLIYYAYADEQDGAWQRFRTFCTAYHGNLVPVIVVVKGLDSSQAAREWVDRHLVQKGAGRPFVTFSPDGDHRNQIAEQELQELIQRSCLDRRKRRGLGVGKRIVKIFDKLLREGRNWITCRLPKTSHEEIIEMLAQ